MSREFFSSFWRRWRNSPELRSQESKEYHGDLAKFYDWRMQDDVEDIPFYVGLAKESGGPVLELGCGTGRVTLPIAESSGG